MAIVTVGAVRNPELALNNNVASLPLLYILPILREDTCLCFRTIHGRYRLKRRVDTYIIACS